MRDEVVRLSSLISDGQIERAITELRVLTEDSPNEWELVGLLSFALQLADLDEEALTVLDKFLEGNPSDVDARAYRLLQLAKTSRIAKLKAEASSLARYPSAGPEIAIALSHVSSGWLETRLSERRLRRQLTLNLGDERLWLALARLLERRRRWKPLLVVGEELAKISGQDAAGSALQARALLGLGRIAEARSRADVAFGKAPGDAVAVKTLIEVAIRSGDRDLSLSMAQQLITESPLSSDATVLMARAYEKFGQKEKAIDLLLEAVARKPTDPWLSYWLARLATRYRLQETIASIRMAGVAWKKRRAQR